MAHAAKKKERGKTMKWLLLIAGILVLGILAMLVLGLLQPVRHSVTRSVRLKQRPEAVFALLDRTEDMPKWSAAVLQVESLPDQNGKPAARVTMKWGHMQMIMTQLERTPPARLVVRMAKEGGPTMGTWTYQLNAENDGCLVELTEQGELQSPFYRAVGRMRGLDANVTQTLHDLANQFGESAPSSLAGKDGNH